MKTGSLNDMVMVSPSRGAHVPATPAVTAISKILSSVEGKDKVLRAFFFGFKVLRAATQRQMQPIQQLETAILDSRRVFRLFRELDTLQALIRQLRGAAADRWLQAGAVGQMAGLTWFLALNHLVLLNKVRLRRWEHTRLCGCGAID
ncbi:MAG: hypothetical protein ACPIOQ_70790, partial [Promethearchaeia archaeon]